MKRDSHKKICATVAAMPCSRPLGGGWLCAETNYGRLHTCVTCRARALRAKARKAGRGKG